MPIQNDAKMDVAYYRVSHTIVAVVVNTKKLRKIVCTVEASAKRMSEKETDFFLCVLLCISAFSSFSISSKISRKKKKAEKSCEQAC